MRFQKIGVLWQSKKKDKNGRPFMNGVIDDGVTLVKGQKVFVFMVDPSKRGPKSPLANIVAGMDGENEYVPPVEDMAPPPTEDDAPPLTDDGEPPF